MAVSFHWQMAARGAVVCAAAAGAAVYGALLPGSQLFGRTLIASRRRSEFALTYDDGPNDRSTPALLDLLAANHVRATFFMIGEYARRRPELARRVLAEGHLVGNHTMTHPWLSFSSARRVREEMRGCSAVLEDVLGQPVRYFRPPHGARRPLVLREAAELGMAVVQWNVMGVDWKPIGAAGIVSNVRAGMQRAADKGRGSNILLHDGSEAGMGTDRTDTVRATEVLLADLLPKGHRAVTVDRWDDRRTI